MEKYIYLVLEIINWKPISMGTWTIAQNMRPSFLESRFPQERKEGKKLKHSNKAPWEVWMSKTQRVRKGRRTESKWCQSRSWWTASDDKGKTWFKMTLIQRLQVCLAGVVVGLHGMGWGSGRRPVVSPHGWASCLWGKLGASPSGALSAAVGLCLRLQSRGVKKKRVTGSGGDRSRTMTHSPQLQVTVNWFSYGLCSSALRYTESIKKSLFAAS